jgi:hypothetical protein
MTSEHFTALLEHLSAKTDKEGWSSLPDGRSMTVYAAHDGVPLTVARIEALSAKGPLVRIRTFKGEHYVLSLDDLFAVAADSTPAQTRKAGFL